MQPKLMINDAEWEKLISDVAFYFEDLTLKRGFQYYKQNRVKALRMVSSRRVMAVVEGHEDYAVSMELDSLTESHCDCPVQGPCKHMAAVLMNVAESQERSVNMLANAKAVVDRKKAEALQDSASAGVSGGRREQAKKIAGLIPGATVEQWREYMALLTAPLGQTVRNPQYADRALAAIAQAKAKLSPAAELLFQLNARLFILESLIQPSSPHNAGIPPSSSYSLGYYTAIAVSELQEAVARLMKHSLPLASEPEEWPRVKDTLAHVRLEMLTESRDRLREQPYFSFCYERLWQSWIAPNTGGPELYLEELDALRERETGLGAAVARPALLLAESRMYFYLNDDKAAWERLAEASGRPGLHPDELMGFLPALAEAGHWSRLAAWLEATGPLLNTRLYNLQTYAGYWEEAVRRLPEAEPQMWNTLSRMLPLSRDIYDEKLLAYGKWHEWMDYQLSSGKEPSDFRVSDLQPVEKNAPELLLPFYHQAAERFVLEKNRHSYKAAVKLLKRLAKLYKKMKREERWAEFLDTFTGRHSRLRALQEELRKGKLIP
ncbi:SWIM zinc finger domain-containing protein [Paenibacillus sp. S150]|uniref:SWIM zinc finger family protein n=1 Tax=Paenibacillus sp. S150 TaxID=2749826 RepID=UPI001C5A4D5B|nr:SWIM zinc finger family protein [Paenibacillus sp. S150]MBW4084771.1 SWIM zinc finger family protein [Paenibacillus sp. S150]